MAARLPSLNASLPFRSLSQFTTTHQCVRSLHSTVKPAKIPQPTPFVPDTKTLLTLIGRGMSKHASKLTTWEQLFTISSNELRELGIESARDRKYIIRWREKFRRQEYGIGGDLDNVVDGVAELRTVEVPVIPKSSTITSGSSSSSTRKSIRFSGTATLSPGMKWGIVNLPPGETQPKDPKKQAKKFAQIKLHRGNLIKGPYVEILKGSEGNAVQIKVKEGMWEHKLGRKIDGGERRRAEVQTKRRIEENKKATK